jgi:hypothetical protein
MLSQQVFFSFFHYVVHKCYCPVALSHYELHTIEVSKKSIWLLLISIFHCRLKMSHNGLQLQEVGDFGDENCLPPLNLIRSTKLHLTTELPISCRCCYGYGYGFEL